jgi:mono/diheme cytochrome c family protein
MQRLNALYLPSVFAGAMLLAAFLAAPLGRAQTPQLPPAVAREVEFLRVESLFKERCQMCHGSQMQMSGLRLDNGEAALKGGYSGAVIVPGDSAGSKLINLVAGLDEKVVMPPAGERLTAEQIGILRAWIDQGA